MQRKLIVRELKFIGIFLLCGGIQGALMCDHCDSTADYIKVISFTFFIWLFLWRGNDLLSTYLTQKISWLEFPLKRLVWGSVSTIAYTVSAIFLLMFFYERVVGLNFGRSYMPTIYISIIVTVLIALILNSRVFLIHWRKASTEAERFQKESIKAQYESLKNQVNPHFLFNSLNALTNLVYEDQDKAVKFIKQLSEVYRYVLDTRDKEVVPLKEDLKFLESYLYLQKMRFGDKLRIQTNITAEAGYVAPLALQMLMENAIKHNVISEDDPLEIKLYTDNGFIVVENNLQRKTILGEPSVGVGLDNIRKRYQFLSHKKVEVINDGKSFLVKLPILVNSVK